MLAEKWLVKKWSLVPLLFLFIAGVTNIFRLLPALDRVQLFRSSTTGEADDDHFRKFAYVLVTYHKSGHGLSHTLVGYLQNNLGKLGGRLRRGTANFNAQTECGMLLSLGPGTITVMEAPEFSCCAEQLAEMIMNNPDTSQEKLGVKIVHLVRNPFTMAVSNFLYHRQDPPPEPFVHHTNPCESLNTRRSVADDFAIRMLSSAEQNHPILSSEETDSIVRDCLSLYRARPDLSQATYYEHLRALGPKEGLRMATADKFRNFALMAKALSMFGQVKKIEFARNATRPRMHRQFDLITMPMDDWINRPGDSMHKFLDFVFHDKMPDHKKMLISSRYEHTYTKKSIESDHITWGKYGDTAELIQFLRDDTVFGPPLSRFELILNGALQLQAAQNLV